MKKKLLVFLCVAALLVVCTMAVAAEDGDGSEKIWGFWNLLSLSNVNYLGVIVTMLTSLFTMLRMFNGLEGIKSLFSTLFGSLKGIIPGSK